MPFDDQEVVAVPFAEYEVADEPDAALELEAGLFAGTFNSADMREGTQAFIEKRKPEFKGR